jgi:hypothetical protein
LDVSIFKYAMLIIIDNKLSGEAKKKLSGFGDLLELKTEGIAYSAISGHPDIFFCQSPDKLIIAPNLPKPYFDQINELGINYIVGEFPVGPEYPASARYNAVATTNHLIHNFRHTDFMITRELEDLQPVHVDQGYCRCNLLTLKDDHFITSDAGIFKVLMGFQPEGFQPNVLFVSSSDILLKGFPHGFFGGCCGVWENKVFINGNLKFYKDGEKVRDFLYQLDYEIIELGSGPLTDIGSIFFM